MAKKNIAGDHYPLPCNIKLYIHFQKLNTERIMLIFGSQSELKKMQFATEVDESIQIC